MSLPYRFAVLSYSPQIKQLLREFSASDEYSLTYAPLQYKKPGMGAVELLTKGYDVVLVYSSYSFAVVDHVGYEAVDIHKTDMDRIKALLEARNIATRVGFPVHERENVDLSLLERLCDVRLFHITYDTPDQIERGVQTAIDRGIRVFAGGGLVMSVCRARRVECVPIFPDRYNFGEAVAKAVSIARVKRQERTRHEQLVAIFKLFGEGVVYVDNEKNCVYSNGMAHQLLHIDKAGAADGEAIRHSGALFLDEVLGTGAPRTEQLVSVHKKQLVVSTLPVTIHSNKQGAVAFLRDVASVHDFAGRIRATQRQQGGFVAHHTVRNLKGRTAGMERLRRRILLYAPHEAPVLIHGETGTGKDLAAQSLHNASGRRNAPFVAINCAALPGSLLESELFGYEEGAFTGAKKGGKPGVFELAHTGTLFLDEVGDLDHNTQLRLLRVLETKEVIRVGGSRVVPVDIRIVSASHKSLPELVGDGRFRADLFYRLAVLRLPIPPLRRRPGDIPLLLEDLLARHGRKADCLIPGILDAMRQYHWPGNIRELKSVVESYLILLGDAPHDEALFLDLFATWTRDFTRTAPGASVPEPSGDLKTIMDEVRRRIVQDTVARCGFNRKEASRRLGISYNTLWRILGRPDDNPDEPEGPDGGAGLADPNLLTPGISDPAS